MKQKSLELDLQMALEGMEELAMFVGFHSSGNAFRVLSVETIEEAAQRELAEKSENVISMESRRPPTPPSRISRSLRFEDRYFQS